MSRSTLALLGLLSAVASAVLFIILWLGDPDAADRLNLSDAGFATLALAVALFLGDVVLWRVPPRG
jgi:hypothetical protein